MFNLFAQLTQRKTLTRTLVVLVLAYVVYQLLTGERGLIKFVAMTTKSRELKQEIADLERQKQELEKKVYGLKSQSLDLDLLDEQTRRNLGYSKQGETIYFE
jgi:cell division protein FtsB